jgi:transcriptional regulator with XRE-family HTH domain
MSFVKIKKTIHAREYHKVISLLRECREAKGLTQKNLADKIGSDQTFISKIEIGERRIDIIELRQICIAMKMTLPEFIEKLESHLKGKK